MPEKIALIEGHADKHKRRRWTYKELLCEVEHLATALLSPFEQGDRIGIYAANSPEWIILHYAIGAAGLISVPINPAYTKTELLEILKTSGASGIFYDAEYRGRDLYDELCVVVDQLPCVKKTVSMSDLQRFVSESTKVVDLPRVDYRNTVLIQFTSGTTGVPKGAQLHHHGVVNVGRSITERAGFDSGGVWINPLPMYQIAGSCVTLLGTLNAMGTYVVLNYFQPELMMELIESEGCTGTLLVPTMIHAMLALPDFQNYNTSSLAFILTGAADVPPSLIEQTKSAFNCDIGIQYGQTEANGTLCQTYPNDSLLDLTTSVGPPLSHAEICIVDQHSNDILPFDTAGEIAFRGYQAMRGYYNREDQQDIVFGDGWIRTGDIGQMDQRGYVKVTGRSKDVIICISSDQI